MVGREDSKIEIIEKGKELMRKRIRNIKRSRIEDEEERKRIGVDLRELRRGKKVKEKIGMLGIIDWRIEEEKDIVVIRNVEGIERIIKRRREWENIEMRMSIEKENLKRKGRIDRGEEKSEEVMDVRIGMRIEKVKKIVIKIRKKIERIKKIRIGKILIERDKRIEELIEIKIGRENVMVENGGGLKNIISKNGNRDIGEIRIDILKKVEELGLSGRRIKEKIVEGLMIIDEEVNERRNRKKESIGEVIGSKGGIGEVGKVINELKISKIGEIEIVEKIKRGVERKEGNEIEKGERIKIGIEREIILSWWDWWEIDIDERMIGLKRRDDFLMKDLKIVVEKDLKSKSEVLGKWERESRKKSREEKNEFKGIENNWNYKVFIERMRKRGEIRKKVKVW